MKAHVFLILLIGVSAARGDDEIPTAKYKSSVSEVQLQKLSSKIANLTAIQGRTLNQEKRLLKMQFAEAFFQETVQARTPEERIRLVDELLALNPETVKEINPHSATK